MKSKHEPEVLIVGAGPVGLCAANWLTRNGVRVEVIDKESQRGGRSYALALHGQSLDLLDEAGLAQEIRVGANSISRIGLFDGKRQRAVVDLQQIEGGQHKLFVIRQSQLEALLETKLKAQGMSVLWRHRLQQLHQDDDGVSVKIDKLKMDAMGYSVPHFEWVVGGTQKETLPCVIGADGYRSRVRQCLPIEFESVGTTEYFAVFEFKSNVDLQDEARVVLDENTVSALWPLTGGHMRWSFQLSDYDVDEFSRDKDRATYEIIGDTQLPALSDRHLHELIEQRAPWFDGDIEEVEWRIVVRFERRLASAFGKDRVLLAGDAAHLTGPVGMQSMNAGLTEASLLAEAIYDGLRDGGLRRRLELYQAERLAEWEFLLGLRGGLRALPGADPWIVKNADRLLSCLPATGEALRSIASSLQLECY